MEINWTDKSRPPHEGLTKIVRPGGIHPPLWWGLTTTAEQPDKRPMIRRIVVWHWCDKSIIRAKPGVDPEQAKPQWIMGGVGKHDLHGVKPLHLEPSLHLPGCCGLHGWIRNGRWVDV